MIPLLEHLKRLHSESTPLPWSVERTSQPSQALLTLGPVESLATRSVQLPKSDAHLVAAVINSLPKIIAALEAADAVDEDWVARDPDQQNRFRFHHALNDLRKVTP